MLYKLRLGLICFPSQDIEDLFIPKKTAELGGEDKINEVVNLEGKDDVEEILNLSGEHVVKKKFVAADGEDEAPNFQTPKRTKLEHHYHKVHSSRLITFLLLGF